MRELINRLARVPGLIIKPGELLSKHTTMQVGGPAELFVRVQHGAALNVLLIELRQAGVGFGILGLGSNVLFPDHGVGAMAVIRFEGDFKQFEVTGDRVRVGAAMPLAQLARKMAGLGLVGLEALSGFPSTVGGAVIMNAGCYGTEIKDVVLTAEILTEEGCRKVLDVSELAPAYRSTNLQNSSSIVTAATFQLKQGNAAAALAKIEEIEKQLAEAKGTPIQNTTPSPAPNCPDDNEAKANIRWVIQADAGARREAVTSFNLFRTHARPLPGSIFCS